ncbi:MAG: glycoside hydrolase family 2 protein [Opitutaceae bacterium]|jgi:beta-mannosidase
MHLIDLHDISWKFGESGKTARLPAKVPGCVHTDLLANGKISDPFYGTNELELQWIGHRDWEYSATFSVPGETLAEDHVELVAEGLDTLATIYLNDRRIGSSENMFIARRIDIRRHLKKTGNQLRIVFKSAEHYVKSARPNHNPRDINDPVGRCTVLRKEQCQFGWDWGPRFVTAGIWRALRIESWSVNRLDFVRIDQRHSANQDSVRLTVSPRFATSQPARCTAILSLDGHEACRSESLVDTDNKTLSLIVDAPRLWWPAGQGLQPLYDLELIAIDSETGAEIGRRTQRIGLRTIELDRHADQWGESFQFVVNGRPVFAKGANWIPSHTFVAGLERSHYERDLRAAAEAHMNMIRVWGGGIYEHESFYDLCDELGLMVWQDFMFACTLYPHDDAFLDSVREEATQQVERLHHRASLALWCGNNELPQINKEPLRDPSTRAGYEKLFHALLPEVVTAHDGATPYWPSSEWRGFFDSTHTDGEKSGDTHFWEVWHRRAPVSEYERWQFRFCSEFGMQSYSSLATQATFCPPDDDNIFGPVMENHQKNRAGNQIISDYISRRYRFPKDQAGLIYLSQVNQAYCMTVANEHFRRISPRCMGAIYWQLNDCWPVASWSSIEFTGAWKALHHAARRFFAPSLVSAHILQDEQTTISNYRKSGDGRVDLYTVHDGVDSRPAVLRWSLHHLDGATIETGERKLTLRPGESTRQKRLNFGRQLAAHGTDRIFLRTALEINGETVSGDTVLFAPPRFIPLQKAKTKITARLISPGEFCVTFKSPVFLHRFKFEIEGQPTAWMSDNFFDLYPGNAKSVTIRTTASTTRLQLLDRISHRSLVDSY